MSTYTLESARLLQIGQAQKKKINVKIKTLFVTGYPFLFL